MTNFNKLLQTLAESQIDFVLIGGLAAVAYGSAQVTQDIDICILMNPEKIEKLRECLAPFHPKHRMTPQKLSFLEIPADTKNVKNLYLQTDLGVLDILSEVTGVGPFEEVNKKANEVKIGGHKIKIMALDDLIKAKQAIGRPKDKATVLELQVIRDRKK